MVLFITPLIVLSLFLFFFNSYEQIKYSQSYNIKSYQFHNGLKSLKLNPYLGSGLGSNLNLDYRNENSPLTEVAPIMILVQTGVIGSFIFWICYLLPLLLVDIKKNNKLGLILCMSHLSILAASISNLFFISGSIGLFFITVLFAFGNNKLVLNK